jgi:hypothetical protein
LSVERSHFAKTGSGQTEGKLQKSPSIYALRIEPEDDGKATMEELGMMIDMVLRVIYPCSYTIFVATVFG